MVSAQYESLNEVIMVFVAMSYILAKEKFSVAV